MGKWQGFWMGVAAVVVVVHFGHQIVASSSSAEPTSQVAGVQQEIAPDGAISAEASARQYQESSSVTPTEEDLPAVKWDLTTQQYRAHCPNFNCDWRVRKDTDQCMRCGQRYRWVAINCPKCEGKGTLTCNFANSNGWAIPAGGDCGGDGRISTPYSRVKSVSCRVCGGDGQATCSYCLGDGLRGNDKEIYVD